MTIRLEGVGKVLLHLITLKSHLTTLEFTEVYLPIVEQKPLVNITKTRVLIVKASKHSATSLMYSHCASDGDFNPLHQI